MTNNWDDCPNTTTFRVGTRSGVNMMVKDGWNECSGNAPPGVYTQNIVFREVFHH
jgi:hypothetical protein